MTRNSATTPHPLRRRAGFTLVELMVVIIIIGILAAFLVPAVQNAVQTARVAEVTSEMHRMESAITQFKGRFGVEPPSGLVFYERGTGGDPSWAVDTTSPAPNQQVRDLRRNTSRAIVRQIWPDFNFGSPGFDLNLADSDGNGANDDDVIFLNGAECLVFFLGGVPKRVDTDGDGTFDGWNVEGFASNPISPLYRSNVASNRIGPFHKTFDPGRLVDTDNDGMPEYLDSLPGQQTPMLFFSSYGGRGYQPYGIDGVFNTADDEILDDSILGRGPFAVYYTTDVNKTDGTMPPDGDPWNPNSFQIISPGYDSEYGYGGEFTSEYLLTDAQNPDPNNPGTSINRDPRYTEEERDNITNFRNERLNP